VDELARAVDVAVDWHAGQRRKSGGGPYVSHLLQVAGLVLEHGGTTEQAIAGLLHDAIEDTDATRTDVEAAFGPTVARIVGECTDTVAGDTPEAKSPWRGRKERFVERLRSAPDDTVLVAACDKRHNLAAIVAELRLAGGDALADFNAGPDEQLWYYESVLDAIRGRIPERLEHELVLLVAELRELVSR
jgi:(p)ppGpp synthase/HD superfamily hydrolase